MEEETGTLSTCMEGIKKAAGDMRHKMARIEEWFILAFIFLSYICAVVQFVIFVG
ncbi:TPA: hypothetical protein MD351_001810 [Escherichia coli]|nr:hypothetical protein [Escherichia coli]